MNSVQTEQPRQPASINGPAWFGKMMEEYLVRWRAYEPFPFAQPADTHNYLSLHQNDYLRLSSHPEVIAAKNSANERSGGGPMASIIYGGDTGEHQQFRDALKQSMNVGDIMLTTAGWTANVGLIESVAGPDTPVYLDYQAHASLWDGAKLAGAKILPVRHNSPEFMERRIKRYGKGIVCIDAYYSTDGSVPDLKRYVEVCEAYDCMLVLDEAHSFGMCGRDGGGLAVELGLETRIPIRTVSMSKALGGNGGFIAASEEVVWFLKHRARSVIFSSSPSPAQSAGSYAALQVALREPRRAATCLEMGALLRKYLIERGIDPGLSASQIISLYFDADPLAAKFYGLMRDRGILVSVFTAPAVPRDTSLARFSIHSDTTPADMLRVADATAECIQKLGVRVTPPYSLLPELPRAMNAQPMNTERAYAIIRDITAVLEARGEKTKTLPEVPPPDATLHELGVDLTAFSELLEELSVRFNGKDFHLEGYLIPEEYYYLGVDKLVAAVASAFKTTCKEPEVVYVDDEEENLFVFKRKFGKKLKLKVFTDPKAALLYVQRTEDVKLVITDEVMPGMSGNELCDAVHDTKPLMKFILITGNPNSDGDLMYRALRRNRFFEFFNKPVDFEAKSEEYLDLINRIIAFE